MNNKIIPFLWFDKEAEDAASFYVSVFRNSKMGAINRYGKEGYEYHGKPEGTVMTVTFTILGQDFTALNGGPQFKFNEAISFEVFCENQEEIDYYWDKLSEGGNEGQCGWLKDKYGVSWQIVPSLLPELMSDPDKAGRVTKAFLQMGKLDINTLNQA